MNNVLAKGTIFQLREKYGLDKTAGIEMVEAAVLERIAYRCNTSTTCTNNYYVIRVA